MVGARPGSNMAEAVTPAEASILQDFFAVQAAKHGPEILATLHSLGTVEAAAGPATPAARNVSVIQRTPKVERPEPPNVLLERRVLEMPEHVKQELLAGTRREGEGGPSTGWRGKLGAPQGGPVAPQGGRTNQQQSLTLVCRVCGERAGKHSYYGGQVSTSIGL